MKKIKRLFRRLKLKLYLWTVRNGIQSFDDGFNIYEKTTFHICLKVIKHPKTRFMITQKSVKRYLENSDIGLYITMYDHSVEILEHGCPYYIKLNKRDWERIIFAFDSELEKRRLDHEKIINLQIRHSLQNVLERISNISNDPIN
jgi:hypothetical protein